MRVIFDGEGFSREEKAELDEVLQRIAAGAGAGCWRRRPALHGISWFTPSYLPRGSHCRDAIAEDYRRYTV